MVTRLEILSDPVCPWCYIGKAKLDRALEKRPDHPFNIQWRPFQLNPDMPTEGMDNAAYLSAKFGGPEGAQKVYARIEQTALDAGIDVDFSRISRKPNTINAHRLLHWAGIEDRQGLVANQLFHRFFKLGQDIGATDVLLDVAKTVGMDHTVTQRLLEGDADTAEIRAADARARDMGVTGVPTFILGGKYVLTGAQETEVWLSVIDEIVEKSQAMDHKPTEPSGLTDTF
ncbi:MAG: DsbA family oxidoreductase [Pseudomonadota bacterium]